MFASYVTYSDLSSCSPHTFLAVSRNSRGACGYPKLDEVRQKTNVVKQATDASAS